MEELEKHAVSFMSITGYLETEYQQIKLFVSRNIEFVDPQRITKKHWETSYQWLKDIDEDDVSFLP